MLQCSRAVCHSPTQIKVTYSNVDYTRRCSVMPATTSTKIVCQTEVRAHRSCIDSTFTAWHWSVVSIHSGRGQGLGQSGCDRIRHVQVSAFCDSPLTRIV